MLIKIEIEGKSFAVAELDQRNPNIANRFYQMLPFEAAANLWGEEIYFEIPLKNEDENTSPGSVKGDVSYWSPGNAFCIFFGQTQPYSPVNHLGKILEGLEIFSNVKVGDRIILNRK
ncbi:MAG: hypothetical protein LUQ38_00410 [Methanotrichaceae archaeon]|nr:hypothetical protein [Methanotrichaceae archaeon]